MEYTLSNKELNKIIREVKNKSNKSKPKPKVNKIQKTNPVTWSDVAVGLFGVLLLFGTYTARHRESHGYGMTRKKEANGLWGA